MRKFEFLKDGSFGARVGAKLVKNGATIDRIRKCTSCPRKGVCGMPVGPDGSIEAEVMIQGSTPTSMDVGNGVPFAKKSGGGFALESYLKALGVSRERVYLTESCFCQDQTGRGLERPPTDEELTTCSAWKYLEWKRSKAKYLILLGKSAVRQVLGPSFPSPSAVYGTTVLCEVFGREVLVLVTHHPRYLMRKPKEWRLVKPGLLKMREYIKGV